MIEEARGLALREGDWKYIPGGQKKNAPAQLYNLKQDIGETHNVATKRPAIAKRMAALLEELSPSFLNGHLNLTKSRLIHPFLSHQLL